MYDLIIDWFFSQNYPLITLQESFQTYYFYLVNHSQNQFAALNYQKVFEQQKRLKYFRINLYFARSYLLTENVLEGRFNLVCLKCWK